MIDPNAVSKQQRCLKQMASQPLFPTYLCHHRQEPTETPSINHHPGHSQDGDRGVISIFIIIIFLATHTVTLCKHS